MMVEDWDPSNFAERISRIHKFAKKNPSSDRDEGGAREEEEA
jgi:hypothetical protein